MMTGWLRAILDSPSGTGGRRPVVNANFESNVPGLYVIGDLAGAPVVKLAMEQGADVAERIASLAGQPSSDPTLYDLIVIGAGAAGLNAALGAQDRGLRVLVLEKNKIANTIEDFPEGKWVYAEPDSRPPKGKLWLDGSRKEELIGRWHGIIGDNKLAVRVEEGVTGAARGRDGVFEVTTSKNVYRARYVVLASGQRGNPRRLGVPGEDREQVYHRLYSPTHYQNEAILIVGGGNSAVEAAITLADQNEVTISYRGSEFSRLFKDNRRKLKEAVAAGKLRVLLQSNVTRFDEGRAVVEVEDGGAKRTVDVPYQHAFVLIGADPPAAFLKSLGLRLENEWNGNPLVALALVVATLCSLFWFNGSNSVGGAAALAGIGGLIFFGVRGNRFAWLGCTFLIAYTIYGAKLGTGAEFWPFRGWGYKALSFFDRPWAFWYTVLYTALMTIFGLQAMKRWGLDRKDRFQIWRYVSLLGFQWVFFFLIPEFLFRWAVEYQWVGAELARDPNFANNAWRSYGIVYAWPLFFYTFFGSPHQVWIVWGAVLSFVLLPLLVLWHGKRYCSWICGCGGLAETLGDRWRHLSPKGVGSIQWERMNLVVLAAAVVITVAVIARDAVAAIRGPSEQGLVWYRLIADVWLVGILPVSLYPFFGGKMWCRYWCPLAKMMEIFSRVFTRMRVSRFAIHSNEKCIACGECSRNCQVGIDVMSFALRQAELNTLNSSCIGCGICVTVCPMSVLSFQPHTAGGHDLIQITQAAAR